MDFENEVGYETFISTSLQTILTVPTVPSLNIVATHDVKGVSLVVLTPLSKLLAAVSSDILSSQGIRTSIDDRFKNGQRPI